MARKILCFILACVAFSLPAATIRVTTKTPRSVQASIDNAKDGDTILIGPGTYTSPTGFVVKNRKNFTIAAEGEVWLLASDSTSDVLSILDCFSVTIKGIKARHSVPGATVCQGSVIMAEGTTGLVIQGCELAGSGAIGVDLVGCVDVDVSGCLIHDNSYAAVALTDVSSVSIRKNTMVRNGSLIRTSAVDGLTMGGNLTDQ